MSDYISRQAAIDIVVFECGKWIGLAREISKQLRQLPSAEPKMGKWVDDGDPLMLTCGNCGYGVMRYNATPFCPKCGEKKEVTE